MATFFTALLLITAFAHYALFYLKIFDIADMLQRLNCDEKGEFNQFSNKSAFSLASNYLFVSKIVSNKLDYSKLDKRLELLLISAKRTYMKGLVIGIMGFFMYALNVLFL